MDDHEKKLFAQFDDMPGVRLNAFEALCEYRKKAGRTWRDFVADIENAIPKVRAEALEKELAEYKTANATAKQANDALTQDNARLQGEVVRWKAIAAVRVNWKKIAAGIAVVALLGGGGYWWGPGAAAAEERERVDAAVRAALDKITWQEGDREPSVGTLAGKPYWIMVRGETETSHVDAQGRAVLLQCSHVFTTPAVADWSGAYRSPRLYNVFGWLKWPERASLCKVAPAKLSGSVPKQQLEEQSPAPTTPASTQEREPGGKRLSIEGDDNSQCYVSGIANGASFSLLIDTGSSDLVFGRNDARRLGFNPDSLSYDESYWSAHGMGHEASVTLREFSLDGVVVGRNVPAKIVETSMDHPLLGASVLKGMHLAYAQGHCVLTLNGKDGPVSKSRRDHDGRRVARIPPAPVPLTPAPVANVPNYNAYCGTAALPPFPSGCSRPVWGWEVATATQKAGFCARVLQSPQDYPAAVPLCRSYPASHAQGPQDPDYKPGDRRDMDRLIENTRYQ